MLVQYFERKASTRNLLCMDFDRPSTRTVDFDDSPAIFDVTFSQQHIVRTVNLRTAKADAGASECYIASSISGLKPTRTDVMSTTADETLQAR